MKRGFSLAELLIWAAVSALALTVLVGLLVPALRLARQTYQRLEEDQVASSVLRRLQTDLAQTAPNGVMSNPTLVVQPIQGLSGGVTSWDSRWIRYRVDSAQCLRRQVQPEQLDPRQPHLPDTNDLAGLDSSLSQAPVLARQVQDFTVQVQQDLVSVRLTLPNLQAAASFRLRSPGL